MKIEKLVKSQKVPDRWYAQLENGESIKVDTGLIAGYSLYTGRELSDNELAELREDAGRFGAKERALRLLSARQMSRKELVGKLLEKGESQEAADDAAELMERIGAVNDREYAGSIVRHYAKKGYGVGRIKSELNRRGIDKNLWDEALEQMPESGDALDTIISRKLGGRDPDAKELKRLTDMLLRRGFSWQEIKGALGRYDEMLEETE